MKKLIRVLALLLAVFSLLTSVAFAANMTAGEVASRMAGIYVCSQSGVGVDVYYKITPSGDNLELQGGLQPGNWITTEIMYNYDIDYVNDDGSEVRFIDSSVSYLNMYEFELLANGNILFTQTIQTESDTMSLVKMSSPDTGDTTNILLPGAMMLFAVAGIAVAVKKREQN